MTDLSFREEMTDSEENKGYRRQMLRVLLIVLSESYHNNFNLNGEIPPIN